MKTITKETIRQYGSLSGRDDSFDDNTEMGVFRKFLQRTRSDLVVVPKPYGPYGVDIAYKDKDGDYVAFFDLERCGKWKSDWPSNWRCLSFLDRKSKYLKYLEFGMVWFSDDLSRFVIAWKDDILKYPVSERHMPSGEIDSVRKVDFSHGTLIGSSFGTRDKQIFTKRQEFKL